MIGLLKVALPDRIKANYTFKCAFVAFIITH